MAGDFESQLARSNRQLERVRIRIKRKRLYLRATLPPKPGDGERPKQYDLPSGCAATPAGLKIAKAKAQEIESQLVRETFSWQPWLKGKDKPPETVTEWLARLEEKHWELTPRNPTKENSWRKDYRLLLLRLPQKEPLTAEILKETILKETKPASRNRKAFCLAYRRLAEFAGIEGIDFRGLAAGYQAKAVSSADLPTDEEIKKVREELQNPAWRWVFSVMAVYGLRPHEAFHLDTSRLQEPPGVLRVLPTTKTGERLVWPCPSSWWQEFQVWEGSPPEIKTKNNNEIGIRVGQQFKRLGVPFVPYALRHAYAIRTAVLGVEVAIAAKWMGHSVTVHTKTYHQAIDEVHHQRAFELMRRNEEALTHSQNELT